MCAIYSCKLLIKDFCCKKFCEVHNSQTEVIEQKIVENC